MRADCKGRPANGFSDSEEKQEFKGQSGHWFETCESRMLMNRRRAKMFVRMTTLLFLPVWVMALAACSFECLSRHCDDHGAGDTGEHANAAHADSNGDQSHNHDAPPAPAKAPRTEGFCASLASTTVSSTPVVVAPVHSDLVVMILASAILPPSTENFSFHVFSRQRKRAIWVLTPEVCLGPALRSHAPPHFC